MKERRFEGRFLCADIVRVDWMTGEDEPRTAEAVLEDISAHSACVQVEERIPEGTTIGITMFPKDASASEAETRYSGYVCYCAYRDYGYFVGIRLAEGSVWSTGAFEPLHLTNMREIVARARSSQLRSSEPRS